MIIPWGTDAPIYHRPIATIALMVLNALVFLLLPPGASKEWVLVLGDGIHPLQWVSNLFIHAGLFHLIGNLIFLWTFGLVVEGKMGALAFVPVYLGLGVVESAGMQLLIHSETPVSMMGSSGIIFGLLAMCLVWAPRNEVLCILWLRFSPHVFDLSILWFAALYIALDVMTAGLQGVVMANVSDRSGGAILALVLDHTSGAILGFLLAIVLLKLRLVDCENWDLFAVLQGRTGQSKKQAKKMKIAPHRTSAEYAATTKARSKRKGKAKTSQVHSIEDAPAAALRAMRQHLDLGEAEAALAVYKKSTRSLSGWSPSERDWLDLIQAVLEQDAWDDAAAVMRDYVLKVAEPSPRVCLKLGQILIQRLGRPLQARKVLGRIPDGSLPGSLEGLRRQLFRQAEALLEEGAIELEDELW